METRRRLLLVPLLLLIACAAIYPLRADDAVPPEAITTAPVGSLDDFGMYAAKLAMLAAGTFAAIEGIGMAFANINKPLLALVVGVATALAGHGSGMVAAPGGGWYGWVFAVFGGLGVARGAKYAADQTNHIKTGGVATVLLCLLLVSTMACVPKYDPQTVADIQRLQSKAAAAEVCPDLIAREAGKSKTEHDKRGVRQISEVCACYSSAKTALEESTCQKYITDMVGYQEAKH